MMSIAPLEGWHFLGAFPDNAADDVGSWLLHRGAEALLLEVPPGLTVAAVTAGLASIRARLCFVTASHLHEDHLDPDCWNGLIDAFPNAEFRCPSEFQQDTTLNVGGEPVWIIKAPKHSRSDIVTIFRGIAMTGDIELGTLRSVNREVPRRTKMASMDYLRGFQDRTGYRVHTIISAHLNDFRESVNWPDIFVY